MTMLRLVAARLFTAVTLLFMGSVFAFLLILAAPGNVAVVMAEARAAYATRSDIEAIEREYGLTIPSSSGTVGG